MDEYRQNVQKVQKALNQDAAFIQPDPYLAHRVLSAAKKEGVIMKKKMLIAWIIAIVLVLSGAVAVAATLLNQHIEKAMDIVKDKGAFSEWAFEDKIALIKTMQEAGIILPQDKLNVMTDAASSEKEKDQAATELLAGIYGSEEHISHFTMASHDWGDPFLWTLEQQEWFWETLRAKGLYTGKIKYLLPGENDLSRDQVVQLARQAIEDAYDLPAEIVQGYDADVTFFTIEGTDTAPRWRVYLGHADAEAADYTVLLTRDGQVTEDASLYIFKPETLATQEKHSSTETSAVLKPYQKRMAAADLLYVSSYNRQYHFLSDCPSVTGEELSSTTNIDGYQPCPYCVLQTQLWSAEDKILYGVMYGELPCGNVISEAKAEQIARDYLLSCGVKDIEKLIPYSRYLKVDNVYQYTVFFARLKNEQVEPVYSVSVNAENGEIVKEFTRLGNGNG